ncbi:MAG: sensor histidine kinase [Campylobacterota bacterium]
MIERYLQSLSIKKVGMISVYLVVLLLLTFALLIVHQEYRSYKAEIASLQASAQEGKGSAIDIVEAKKEEFRIKKMRYVIGIGGLTLFMFITIYAIIRTISYLVEFEFATFISEFKAAAKEHKWIDSHKFNFSESKAIVGNANEMIAEILDRESDLKKLNKSLENKVKEKTKKLQRLVEAQDEFIKKSIHEVNTPLSIILTNIDLLKMQGETNQNLQNIESASKLIHNLFNDLSYLVKKDRIQYPRQRIDLSQFLKQRLNFFSELANVNGLHLVTNIENNVTVCINETKLQRIIDNNLSNIIKYSHRDSGVFVSLRSESGQAFLRFQNSSDTIKDLEKIFDEYYREDRVKGGYGIGLSIVKEICDENDIAVHAASQDGQTVFEYKFGLGKKEIG